MQFALQLPGHETTDPPPPILGCVTTKHYSGLDLPFRRSISIPLMPTITMRTSKCNVSFGNPLAFERVSSSNQIPLSNRPVFSLPIASKTPGQPFHLFSVKQLVRKCRCDKISWDRFRTSSPQWEHAARLSFEARAAWTERGCWPRGNRALSISLHKGSGQKAEFLVDFPSRLAWRSWARFNFPTRFC